MLISNELRCRVQVCDYIDEPIILINEKDYNILVNQFKECINYEFGFEPSLK